MSSKKTEGYRVKFLDEMEERVQKIMNPRPLFDSNLGIHIPPQPVTYQQVKGLIKRKGSYSSKEILYTKDKRLVRLMGNKEFSHSFFGDNQRTRILESLIESGDKFVPTETLRKLAKSPSADALRQSIHKMNKEIGSNLILKKNLIFGRGPYGYKFNEEFSVVEEF